MNRKSLHTKSGFMFIPTSPDLNPNRPVALIFYKDQDIIGAIPQQDTSFEQTNGQKSTAHIDAILKDNLNPKVISKLSKELNTKEAKIFLRDLFRENRQYKLERLREAQKTEQGKDELER